LKTHSQVYIKNMSTITLNNYISSGITSS